MKQLPAWSSFQDNQEDVSEIQALLNQTWKIRLVCNNCTQMGDYEFPVRRRFYGYTPTIFGPDGEIFYEQDWSRVGSPRDEAKGELVFCRNCKVPMLTGAPMPFQNTGLPPMGVVK